MKKNIWKGSRPKSESEPVHTNCSYVEPTGSFAVFKQRYNLTFVTSSMIASTLLTSGVENCNVVAASPIEVSGTGALTGIMMAYESASGEKLSEDQKAAATEDGYYR